ncbi:MAG: dihydrolipoamide acetyltransferase family protein [Anaerolineales bacterium]
MPTKVLMPEMGEGVTDATITQWLKKEGDKVEQYDALVEVNTDKVDTEIPSPVSGTVLKIMHPPDTVVAVDEILAWIGEPGEEVPAQTFSAPTPPKKTPAPPPSSPVPAALPAPSGSSLQGVVTPLAAKAAAELGVDVSLVPGTGFGGQVIKRDVLAFSRSGPAQPPAQKGPRSSFISPAVSRLAAENNIDLSLVTGTGKDGRITTYDIKEFLQGDGHPPAPAPPGASLLKLSPVRRSIAKHMVESKRTSPHVSTFMEVDMSQVTAHRGANKEVFAEKGSKLTFTAYFVSAIIEALKAYPLVNSSWSDEGIILHEEINVGMAVSLGDEGLIVPVIKQANDLSLFEVSQAVNDLAERARSKKLEPDEVRGGTFTITNHGTSRSLFATPIINQPQCGILGTGAIQKRPVVVEDQIVIRPMVYLGLTFDHRILDGAVADHFLGKVKTTLEEWE